jgi:hypothetical protein
MKDGDPRSSVIKAEALRREAHASADVLTHAAVMSAGSSGGLGYSAPPHKSGPEMHSGQSCQTWPDEATSVPGHAGKTARGAHLSVHCGAG